MSKNEKPSSRFRRFSLPVALGTVLIVLAATFNAASAMPPLQADGEALFTSKGCNACHTIGGGDLVGPDLAGVTELRTQEWLTNWLIAPSFAPGALELADQIAGIGLDGSVTLRSGQVLTREQARALFAGGGAR